MISAMQTELAIADFSDLGETSPAATTDLTTADRAELGRYERVIERGLMSFMEVGTALIAIRDGKLYRGTHGTFEDYCQGRWGISRSYAHRTIGAVEVVNNLLPIGNILPATESQARPLTALAPEQQREAWAKAVEDAPSGKPTAVGVAKAAAKFTEPKPSNPRAEVKRMTEPYEAPAPKPATVVYVEPSPELATEWVRLESARLSIQGFKMQKVNGRFRYVWERQDQAKIEYSEAFAFVADAYDAAFARLRACGLDDRFPPEPTPDDAPTPDELEAVAIVAAELAEEDAERVERAVSRTNPADNVPELVAQRPGILTREWVVYVLINAHPTCADFASALKAATRDDLREAMAGFDQEEKHWRARLDAINARWETLVSPPDPRIAEAQALIAILAAARDGVRADYGRLCGKDLDTLAFGRDVETMVARLSSLVAILTGKEVSE